MRGHVVWWLLKAVAEAEKAVPLPSPPTGAAMIVHLRLPALARGATEPAFVMDTIHHGHEPWMWEWLLGMLVATESTREANSLGLEGCDVRVAAYRMCNERRQNMGIPITKHGFADAQPPNSRSRRLFGDGGQITAELVAMAAQWNM